MPSLVMCYSCITGGGGEGAGGRVLWLHPQQLHLGGNKISGEFSVRTKVPEEIL